MRFNRMFFTGALALLFATGSALAQDKAAKQAEVTKATQAALQKFYAAKPELKAAVAKAPGYGVFTSYGVSFLVGGAGGKGVVHDSKSGKNTYMAMASGSVGMQIGAAETDVLIVFKTAAAMNDFVDKGWTAGGGATAGAGADGKTAGGGRGGNITDNFESYTLTKTGLEAGISVGGSKFWKDGDLN
jgi:lipid-binding SYLF domain-containing protein